MTAGSVLLAALTIAAASTAYVYLPALHPAQLWLLPWAGVTGLFALHLLPYQALSSTTTAFIAASSVGFCVGTLATRPLWQRLSHRTVNRSSEASGYIELAAALAVAATLIGLCLFLAQLAATFGLRSALITSPDVRIALGTGAASAAIKYIYFAFAAAALTGVAAARARSASRRLWWGAAAAVCVGVQYFSTGRSNVLLAAIVASTAYVLARPSAPSKGRLAVGTGLICLLTVPLFIGMGSLVGKTYEGGDISTFRHFFNDHPVVQPLATPYQYATAPIPSLNVVVGRKKSWGRADGCASFRVACSALRGVGVGAVPEPKLSAFTRQPSRWNTFTALYGPLVDFGPYLGVLLLAVEGLAVGLAWHWARGQRADAIALYACLAPAVAYSIVENSIIAPHLLGAGLIAVTAVQVARRLSQWSIRETSGPRAV